jgi:hypothetical protein
VIPAHIGAWATLFPAWSDPLARDDVPAEVVEAIQRIGASSIAGHGSPPQVQQAPDGKSDRRCLETDDDRAHVTRPPIPDERPRGADTDREPS